MSGLLNVYQLAPRISNATGYQNLVKDLVFCVNAYMEVGLSQALFAPSKIVPSHPSIGKNTQKGC